MFWSFAPAQKQTDHLRHAHQNNSTTAPKMASNSSSSSNSTQTQKPPPVTRPENMLPIMIVLGVMFIGICIAMNLFSRARFKKQRSRAFATTAPRAATPLPRRSASAPPKPLGGAGSQTANRLNPSRASQQPASLSPSPQQPSSRQGSRHHSITLSQQAAARLGHCKEDNV